MEKEKSQEQVVKSKPATTNEEAGSIKNVLTKNKKLKKYLKVVLSKEELNSKSPIIKYGIVEDERVLLPKSVLEKHFEKIKKQNDPNFKKKKTLVEKTTVRKLADLNNVPAKEWREFRFSKYLELNNVKANIIEKCNTWTSAVNDKIIVKIATKEEMLSAYQKIRSCMSGDDGAYRLEFYFSHDNVFVPLIFLIGKSVIGRAWLVRYRFGNYVCPIRIYTSRASLMRRELEQYSSNTQLNSAVRVLSWLDSKLLSVGLKIPEILTDHNEERSKIYCPNNRFPFSHFQNYYTTLACRCFFEDVNELPPIDIQKERYRLPFLDFSLYRDNSGVRKIILGVFRSPYDALNQINHPHEDYLNQYLTDKKTIKGILNVKTETSDTLART